MNQHLTKIKAGANVHSYVDPAEPHTMHGQRSACVLQLNNETWCVEYRDGARFMHRNTHATARQAIAAAKTGGRVARTITGPGWSAFMADQLYNTPCGATDALQAYLDRCHRRGLRADLHRFMHAHKTTGAND
jgi:hypothetical protein